MCVCVCVSKNIYPVCCVGERPAMQLASAAMQPAQPASAPHILATSHWLAAAVAFAQLAAVASGHLEQTTLAS